MKREIQLDEMRLKTSDLFSDREQRVRADLKALIEHKDWANGPDFNRKANKMTVEALIDAQSETVLSQYVKKNK
jgi:hypothetical protein